MKILVIRMSAMGDVAMTVPVVASFVRRFPEVEVTVLSNPRFEGMFPSLPNLRFIGADTKRDYVGLVGIFKLFKKLSSQDKYDRIIDLHDVLRSKVLRALFRLKGVPKYVIDKGRSDKKALTRADNKRFVQLKTSVERYRDVFAKAGYNFDLEYDGLFSKENALSSNILSVTGEKNEKWLAIAPFAQHQGKIYPLEKMEKVIATLSEKKTAKILLFGGGKKEVEVLESWAAKYQGVISLAGKFSLNEEIQILNASDLLISMDSSNMHLASLVNTPVVSIWGATHPFAGFYGYGQNPNNIIQKDMPCRPCSIYGNKPCMRGDYACLNQITAEEVVAKVESVLFGPQK
ncbi:MAG: glycosyltransferase family 9 protein [Paludibacteraceae bacterium]|nr:glycosyltransferase family 9 protein [Paludibacteraceae bacterium]